MFLFKFFAQAPKVPLPAFKKNCFKLWIKKVPEDISINAPKVQDVLTRRELEIIRLVAMGLSSEKIAEELVLSSHTVRTHQKNILANTDCANTTELVAKCLVEGLV